MSIKAGQLLLEDALARVELGAGPDWMTTAMAAVRLCAERLPSGFSADDVWDVLGDNRPSEPRALGAVLAKAAAAGVAISTGRYVPSRIPSRHSRPVMVWRRG